MTIDISGLPQERISAVPSALAELGMALHAMTEPGHHPNLQGWASATAAGLDCGLADRLSEADFLWRTTFSDVFLPFAGQPGRTALPASSLAEELDQLDALTDAQFVSASLEFTCDPTYGLSDPNPLDNASARTRALELAAARGPHQVTFTQRLLDDPPSVRAWFRRLIEDCDKAFFADTWERLRLELSADARHKNELLRHKGLAEALADASQAISYDEPAALISVDKLAVGRAHAADRLTLVPTSLGRPHVMVLHRIGWQPVIHYPLAAGGPSATSVQDLTRRIEALAHPVRIRLCRHLARGAYTTGELADAHGMTAPEISRHLSVLKKAGLLTTQRRGRYVMHQLDLAKVVRLGSDFVEGVLR